jgi:hypothetical protein
VRKKRQRQFVLRDSETTSDLLALEGVIQLLQEGIRKAGSQRAWAAKKGVDRTVVNQTLRKRKVPGPSILGALGLKSVVAFRREK